MIEVEKIARGLTEAEKRMIDALGNDWRAGPTLPPSLTGNLAVLREIGLVEREFGDTGKPTFSASDATFQAKLSACWWFRLLPLGLAVRQYLQGQPHG